jgi:hypothetical protein
MLSETSNTVTLNTPFSVTLTVTSTDETTGETTTSPDVPTVTASFTDPGITIATSSGTVTISGSYQSILKTTWHWIDEHLVIHSGLTPPAVGAFKKMTGVDSPSSLTSVCNYTISTSAGSDTFAQTVTLGSYSTIANKLKSLVASIKI